MTTRPIRRRQLTRNRMGWAAIEIHNVSALFLDACRSGAFGGSADPILDLGSAYGLVGLAALRAGAWVILNDLDERHLAEAEADAEPEDRRRLTLRAGHFPRVVDFPDHSLGAVHACNVLHFLNGRELERGLRAIARWLQPGGMLFAQVVTPYLGPFQAFQQEYERRLAEGVKWPGWIPKVSVYSQHRKLGQMPASVHLLDDQTLARAAANAGLVVERAWMFRPADLAPDLTLDGREAAGLIARAPGV
ncbi:class I SAM-dependent methyltransferase [uncultured Paludibaculum sp.]|uniref:class I SAM-dependent methyltransferase n=1 Tax=uncultured Paludibaculum sp. TaxID=1765020 RepID=UPI002AAB560D|nr:class I SAM-dependent methyltransferase [uncultured Paludibaculum sp.]